MSEMVMTFQVGTSRQLLKAVQSFRQYSTKCVTATLCSLQSKRGERDGHDTLSGDEQTGGPLHVLSDLAQQQQGSLARQPPAPAPVASSTASAGMHSRSNGTAAAGGCHSF